MNRRQFLLAVGAVTAALAARGLATGCEPVTVYLPVVSRSTMAAWGFVNWDEFTWG